jgi:hypothetical protein
MKALKTLLISAGVMALTTSCLENDDPYSSGFSFIKPATGINGIFANNTSDSVIFYSYGKWNATSGSSWMRLSSAQGQGSMFSTLTLDFDQNLTGEGRMAQVNFTDISHPDDGKASLLYVQYATRGDGSLGNAADVKSISCTDGQRIDITYDQLHRPLTLDISRDGSTTRSLKLRYNDTDSVITIDDGSKRLTSFYNRDYQPLKLTGDGDTLVYTNQYYSNYMPISANYAFNLEHRSATGVSTIYALLLGGQSLAPDSLHCADSLRIATYDSDATVVKKLKLQYSAYDNRHQNIDVNQLVFGIDQCDPYQLLSLFRYTRNTSILSSADEGGSGYVVEAELNANKSVGRLTVKRKSGGVVTPDTPTVYTFEY